MKLQRYVAASMLGMLLLLVACGPAGAQQAVEDAVNTAASGVPSLPADVQATVDALTNDADVNAAASAVGAALEGIVPQDLQLQTDQPLVLDTTQQVAGVTNYRWTVAEVPAGAESVKGQVISENSDGKLTIAPQDYAKYFPASGEYTINLELTFQDGTKQTQPIPLTVP